MRDGLQDSGCLFCGYLIYSEKSEVFHTLTSLGDRENVFTNTAGGEDKLKSELIPFWWGLSNLAPSQ